MREKGANPDAVIARIAARQHGSVSVQQLIAAGISKDTVFNRVKAARLHRIHRGVYAVGHAGLSNEGRWMAAVMACGEGAVLSRTSAAALWGLLPAGRGAIDVTVPSEAGRRRRAGIRLHRSPSMPDSATTRRNGIAVTTPARTIADLRRMLPAEQLRRALRQAAVLGLDIGETDAADLTRSELERLCLGLCRRHRLPAPEVNQRVGPFLVDFLWRDRRLIVETDGYRYHRGRQAFEDDRARDVELRRLGFEAIRFTYRQVTENPGPMAAALNAGLSRS